jgi:Flp pilus assembly protein TadB
MFIAFIITLSGLAFASRIASQSLNDRVLTRRDLTKIGTCYFFSLVGLLSIAHDSLFSLWVAVFLPTMIFVFALVWLKFSRAKKFRERFVMALQLIILKMKSSRSFRTSLNDVIDESDSLMKLRLSEIRDIVVFSPQESRDFRNPFVDLILRELKLVDENPHAAIKRLSVFRDRLKIEDDFRHKSGQALRQVRAQSLIMSGLYLAIAFFIAHSFGFKPYQRLFLISALLFSIGLVWIHIGGRKMKWKV